MTLRELLDTIKQIDGVMTMFKTIEGRLVLIFWKNNSPIASVFVDEYEYRKDYPELFEMNLNDLFTIDQALYDFTQTPIEERELDF